MSMSKEQQEMLCQYMKSHPDQARHCLPNANARKRAKNHWLKIVNQLNASGPQKKDVKMWKRTWADLRYTVKKMTNNKQSIHGTGGGPYTAVNLTNVEEDVCLASGLHSACSKRTKWMRLVLFRFAERKRSIIPRIFIFVRIYMNEKFQSYHPCTC